MRQYASGIDSMEALRGAGQRAFQRAHRTISFAIGSVDLRLGQRAPRARIGISGDLARDVVVQAGVGKQPCLGEMGAVLGKTVGEIRHRQP